MAEEVVVTPQEQVAVETPVPSAPLFAVEVKMFVDNLGRQIQHRVPIIGTPPEGFIPFGGRSLCSFEMPGTKHLREELVNFNIEESTTPEEAFKNFDKYLNKAIPVYQAAIARQQEEAARKAAAEAKMRQEIMAKLQAEKDELKQHREELKNKIVVPGS